MAFFLLLALKIQTVILPVTEIEVYVGSPVILPCTFYTDNPFQKLRHLIVEWVFTPEGNDTYRPILKLFDNISEQLDTSNARAGAFVSLLPGGNCSLAINPTSTKDSGTYKVYLNVDGAPYVNSPAISLKVFNEDPDVVSLIRIYQRLKASGMMTIILIAGGVVLCLLISGCLAGLHFQGRYYKLIGPSQPSEDERQKDSMVRMEEGFSSSSETESDSR
ncbi:uncharacterized protein LOC128651680 [Bombina bombina]|uniref:uncharacterized protein LOC128651680 n=1 Tax=Bombina bombina TaxID=8345 RepID=UPI00235A7792|nr:uncharacterized protein LOC128651680 [Bombina bombina]